MKRRFFARFLSLRHPETTSRHPECHPRHPECHPRHPECHPRHPERSEGSPRSGLQGLALQRSYPQTGSHPAKNQSERGFIAAEWVFGIALLVFPAFVLILSLVQVPARKNLTQVASAAAVRAYVQALDQSQAEASARAAAADAIVSEIGEEHRSEVEEALEQQNGKIEVKISGTNGNDLLYCPGSEVKVEVTMPMPSSINPFDPGVGILPVGELSSSTTGRIPDFAELADVSGPPLNKPDEFFDINRDGVCPE